MVPLTLDVKGLSKEYGGKRVLHDAHLTVRSGEIHALLGPNGSGKSTLIGCLGGSISPDESSVRLDGVAYVPTSPAAAMAMGTAVIHQHFSLIPTLTVAANIFLGREVTRRGWLDRRRERVEADTLLEQFQRPIDPDELVSNLSVGDRQLVEIAKALHQRPRLLILDEPTAALGESEAQELGRTLLRLRETGIAIIYVTHILSEVFKIADTVTVLRDGLVAMSKRVSEVNPSDVIEAIAPGSAMSTNGRATVASDEAMLVVDDLRVGQIGPVSMRVQRSEIVGIFGLLGSGRTEILEGIYGVRPVAGHISIQGTRSTGRHPRAALRSGIALVAGDRQHQGIFDKLTSLDNLLMPHFSRLARSGRRSSDDERSMFDGLARLLDLQPKDPKVVASALSGGNQQKLAVGRWLGAGEQICVLMLDEPTQGIDVGARNDLYNLLRQYAHVQGGSVLFTSSDPDETVALADRVVVLRRGRVASRWVAGEFDQHRLLEEAHAAEEQKAEGSIK